MRSSSVKPVGKLVIGLGLSASLVFLGACGKDDPSTGETAEPSASASASATGSASPSASAPAKAAVSNNFDKVTVSGDYGKSPKVSVKSPWSIDKTRTKVLKPSDGAVIQAGSTVEVDYYGVDGRTGKKFDDSYSRGAPVAFPLDQVVPGFSKGLVGQRQGSRVLIAMPGSDGYDSSGGNAAGRHQGRRHLDLRGRHRRRPADRSEGQGRDPAKGACPPSRTRTASRRSPCPSPSRRPSSSSSR